MCSLSPVHLDRILDKWDYLQCPIIKKKIVSCFSFGEVPRRADAHFASKNTLLKRNTLHCYILLKRTVCFKLACYSLLFNTLYPSTHFASWNVFLLGTLCPPTPFTSQNPFLLSTVCFSTAIAPQNTLLLNTLCSSAHCTPQHTLLLSTLCFKEHFTPRNTLLLRTLYSLAHFAPWNTLLPRVFAMP